MWLYVVAAALVAAAAVYAIVVLFSHTPRRPFPEEETYETNDGQGRVHPLPPRAQPGDAKSTSAGDVELSVVIPCYNEIDRLGAMLDECVPWLQHHPRGFEVVIVDDGSSDGTGAYALEKATELKLKPGQMRVVTLTKNRGKGGAVTHGMLHARGDYVLFADADGATQFKDAEKLLQWLRDQPSHRGAVAVGSRAHMVNTDAVVKRSFIRNFLMYGLHTLVYVFGIRDVKDTQCGFKMFNRKAVTEIFPHMHTERWIFDVEVLILAERQQMPVEEIAVTWHEISGSKVDLARDSINMAIDLVVTRLAYLLGVYTIRDAKKDL
ncbi:hypothetical protein DIURU_003772 [Diutina rugosa]|uniref:dolichyl-phosphate beta-glucosyltransferase n=1 Tax=Diutina rugosa TaxID=5481 RepID=A0A642UK39_DIURU|nr:uncharacterized protein DIURU_003772 [Diutina rugosa]KAA8900474.1 hypothetical protein DIURU_003772 [Diutina rugosa]